MPEYLLDRPEHGANVLNKRAPLQNSCPILNRNARCFASPHMTGRTG
jgi:hypothetical protein